MLGFVYLNNNMIEHLIIFRVIMFRVIIILIRNIYFMVVTKKILFTIL